MNLIYKTLYDASEFINNVEGRPKSLKSVPLYSAGKNYKADRKIY